MHPLFSRIAFLSLICFLIASNRVNAEPWPNDSRQQSTWVAPTPTWQRPNKWATPTPAWQRPNKWATPTPAWQRPNKWATPTPAWQRPNKWATPTSQMTYKVVRVIDGDTIVVDIDGEQLSLRYIGINTPETGENCGDQATIANKKIVEGKFVRLEKDVTDKDRYGRLLRYVYVGDIFVNSQLVRLGYAESKRYSPDTKHSFTFDQLENEAKAKNIGCHPYGAFEPNQTIAPTKPASPPANGVVCSCSSNSFNCPNFPTHDSAQQCFNYCKSQGRGDIHRLDKDNDNLACENNP